VPVTATEAITAGGRTDVATGSDGHPLDRLRRMHSAGTLASDYGSVPALLNEIAAAPDGPADLMRAGLILGRLDAEEVRREAAVETVTVAVTGHGTLGSLLAPLTAEFARHGLLLEAHVGDFDAYLRDLQDTASHLYAPGLHLALCVLDPQIVIDELPRPWAAEDVERVAEAKLAQLDRLVERYADRAGARLVLNTVPLQRVLSHQLVDHRSRAALGIAWRRFNVGLLGLAARHPGVSVIDLDPLVADGGPVNDPRLAQYAKAYLSDELLAGYAREVAHLTRALFGRSRKILVTDLDNTLWDGVLGDDGADGIAAATTFRGEAFGRFQQVVRQLASQGVLLAVSSKNDQEAVLDVLRTHPDMLLRDTDFVRINANWSAKDASLRDIAERLNLSLDAFVFVDDSPFETGLVASSLPQVAVVRLGDEPATHVARLLADGWFDVFELTAEDRARTTLYRSDAAREELLQGSDSPQEYLRQLGITVTIARVAERDVGRIAQLTLRTNQFNLTTERLQPDEVRARATDPAWLVLAIRSADRFGDNGVVGAIFARWEADTLHIENMLLSCRVFARGIEHAAMAALLAHAGAAGATRVTGEYRPTAKNKKSAQFYPSAGFEPIGGEESGALFGRDLSAPPAVPDHIRLDARLEGSSHDHP
jgi:FkbH-like protein